MVADKKDIEKVARKLEHERDLFRARDPYFDYAEVLLQIAIVCASVAILSVSRPMVAVSGALAILRRAADRERLHLVREDSVPAAALELGADVHHPRSRGTRVSAVAPGLPGAPAHGRDSRRPAGSWASRNKSVSPAAA